MPFQFEYSGVDSRGQPARGVVEGESPLALVLELRNAGIRVYSINRKLSPERGLTFSKRIRASDLIAFNEQLASLLRTKLPLAESLRHLSREMRDVRLRTAAEKIGEQLEAGRTLSEGIMQQREYFPPLYANMVEAGEKSGNLAEVLYQVANYLRSAENFRRKFAGALVYPLMVTSLALAVLILLIKLMVPPYVEMYSGFHTDFPLSLKLLVYAENFLRPNVSWVFIAALILIAAAFFLTAGRKSEYVRTILDRTVLKIPVWGQMIKEVFLAQNLATLAILLRGGIPLYESLGLVRNLVSNRPVRNAFESAATAVLEGENLSQALLKQPLFPMDLVWVIRNGESNGDLIQTLENAARMYRGKLEVTVQVILSVLEPLVLIIMGVVVVSIAISLFYPLYSLSKYLGT